MNFTSTHQMRFRHVRSCPSSVSDTDPSRSEFSSTVRNNGWAAMARSRRSTARCSKGRRSYAVQLLAFQLCALQTSKLVGFSLLLCTSKHGVQSQFQRHSAWSDLEMFPWKSGMFVARLRPLSMPTAERYGKTSLCKSKMWLDWTVWGILKSGAYKAVAASHRPASTVPHEITLNSCLFCSFVHSFSRFL